MSSPIPNAPWCKFPDNLPDGVAVDAVGGPDVLRSSQALTGCRMASTILFNLTGQRWPGEQTTTIWPNSRPIGRPVYVPSPGILSGVSDTGALADLVIRPDRWQWRCQLDPGRYPVNGIVDVTVDGNPIEDLSQFRIDDRRTLVWETNDANQTWPWTQDIAAPDGQPGSWSTTIRWGQPVPQEAADMAGMLAWQITLGLLPDCECTLPAFASGRVRRGESVKIDDPMDLIEKGQVGYRPVDLWVASINAGKTRRRGTVFRLGAGRRTSVRRGPGAGS